MAKYGQEAVCDCFLQIQQIFIKSLLSVQKTMINDKHCFELYGYDILIDANLKAWLIEVNASPSLLANTQQDRELKVAMLDDTFTVIDMEKVLTNEEEQVGGFDLIYKGSQVKMPLNCIYQTYLGCFNNRNAQLKKLAKMAA